mmetsp:Transcript_56214/g.164256  ORF Transcript_56214/g.164256 Transcript_56214/m.164256 type:complete len:276 (+) Transcript_56214:689-1516(+)
MRPSCWGWAAHLAKQWEHQACPRGQTWWCFRSLHCAQMLQRKQRSWRSLEKRAWSSSSAGLESSASQSRGRHSEGSSSQGSDSLLGSFAVPPAATLASSAQGRPCAQKRSGRSACHLPCLFRPRAQPEPDPLSASEVLQSRLSQCLACSERGRQPLAQRPAQASQRPEASGRQQCQRSTQATFDSTYSATRATTSAPQQPWRLSRVLRLPFSWAASTGSRTPRQKRLESAEPRSAPASGASSNSSNNACLSGRARRSSATSARCRNTSTSPASPL